jgi:hypothetical protein
VVEVAVRDQDRLDLDAHRLDRGEDAVGLVAGIDDQAAAGAFAAHDEAVLRDLPDREHLHVEAHRYSRARMRARSRRRHIAMSM